MDHEQLQVTNARSDGDDDHQRRVSKAGKVLKLSRLHLSILEQDIPAVRRLIESGADVNAVSANGITPLMLAALLGSLPMVSLMLDSKAKFDLRDDSKRTASYYALGMKSRDRRIEYLRRITRVRPTKSGERKKILNILSRPSAVQAHRLRNKPDIPSVAFGWNGDEIQTFSSLRTVGTGVMASGIKTPAALVPWGANKPVMMAVSGWTMTPGKREGLLNNRDYSKLAKWFCKKAGLELRASMYDNPSATYKGEVISGQATASHVERQLGLYFLFKQLKYAFHRVRVQDVKRLRQVKLPRHRRIAFIYLGHESVCGPCWDWLDYLKKEAGLYLIPISSPVYRRFVRPIAKPKYITEGQKQTEIQKQPKEKYTRNGVSREADGKGAGTEMDNFLDHIDATVKNKNPARVLPSIEKDDSISRPASRSVISASQKLKSSLLQSNRLSVIRSSPSPSMPSALSTPKIRIPHSPTPEISGGKGSHPNNWPHGKPRPTPIFTDPGEEFGFNSMTLPQGSNLLDKAELRRLGKSFNNRIGLGSEPKNTASSSSLLAQEPANEISIFFEDIESSSPQEKDVDEGKKEPDQRRALAVAQRQIRRETIEIPVRDVRKRLPTTRPERAPPSRSQVKGVHKTASRQKLTARVKASNGLARWVTPKTFNGMWDKARARAEQHQQQKQDSGELVPFPDMKQFMSDWS